jgi:hypothetical protein
VEIGKNFITAAIAGSYKIGKHFALAQLKSSAGATGKTAGRSSHSKTSCSCCS